MSETAPIQDQARPEPRNGLGLAAIILGLVGLLFGMIPFTGFIAVILGIIGLALGLSGLGRIRRKRATNRWTTRIGTLVSAGAIALGIWGIAIVFGAVDEIGDSLDELDRELEQIEQDYQDSLDQ